MSICLIFSLLCLSLRTPVQADELKPKKGSTYVRVTGDDTEGEKSHWDSLFNTTSYVYGTEPAGFLKENVHLLPVGRVLDLAMAEGRNSVFLAKKGFQVTGVDYSEVALRKAKRMAHESRVTIQTINADLTEYQIRPNSYDVILDIDFLQRSLISQIKRGLKCGGTVVYEGDLEIQLQLQQDTPGVTLRRETLLKKGELREAFRDFQIVVYRETNEGKASKVSMIARKNCTH